MAHAGESKIWGIFDVLYQFLFFLYQISPCLLVSNQMHVSPIAMSLKSGICFCLSFHTSSSISFSRWRNAGLTCPPNATLSLVFALPIVPTLPRILWFQSRSQSPSTQRSNRSDSEFAVKNIALRIGPPHFSGVGSFMLFFGILMLCPPGHYLSSTWFEASILRPSGIPRPLPRSAINMNNPLNLRKLGWTEICNPRDRNGRRWQVQANSTESLPKFHSVTWEPTLDAGEATFDDRCDLKTGKGSGLGFIQTLRAGDRIALIGRASVS